MEKTFLGEGGFFVSSAKQRDSLDLGLSAATPALRALPSGAKHSEEAVMVFSRSAANLKLLLVIPKHSICSFWVICGKVTKPVVGGLHLACGYCRGGMSRREG